MSDLVIVKIVGKAYKEGMSGDIQKLKIEYNQKNYTVSCQGSYLIGEFIVVPKKVVSIN